MRAAFSAKIKWLTEEYAKNIFLRPAFPSHLYSSLSLHKILIKIFVFDKYCWLHALVRAVLLKNKNKTKQCSFHANWGEMWIRHWKIMLLLTAFSWWRFSVHFLIFFFFTEISSKNEYFLRRIQFMPISDIPSTQNPKILRYQRPKHQRLPLDTILSQFHPLSILTI